MPVAHAIGTGLRPVAALDKAELAWTVAAAQSTDLDVARSTRLGAVRAMQVQ